MVVVRPPVVPLEPPGVDAVVEGCVPSVESGPSVVLGWTSVVTGLCVVPGTSVLTVVPSVLTVVDGSVVSELTTEVIVVVWSPLSAVCRRPPL